MDYLTRKQPKDWLRALKAIIFTRRKIRIKFSMKSMAFKVLKKEAHSKELQKE